VFGTLLERAQHLISEHGADLRADGVAFPAITSTCRLACPFDARMQRLGR